MHNGARRLPALFLVTALLGILSFPAVAQTAPSASSPAPTRPAAQRNGWIFFGNWRLRPEIWSWFGTSKGQTDYTYIGSLLRFGFSRQTSQEDILLEMAQPTLLNLPRHATAPPPQGQLGLGAAYRDASGSQNASLFIKQGYVRLKHFGAPASSLRLGRFEFIEGLETNPSDPSLAWLKRERIAHRLIGNFGWSHVGRSLDGFQFSDSAPKNNLTLVGAFPTRGVFDVRGMDTLTDVKVAYLADTFPVPSRRSAGEGRLFGIYYEDTRPGVVKTDNRSAALRAADTRPIRITTFGAHYLRVAPAAGGKVDGLFWAAGQLGDWGALAHRAYAYALEVGYQPNRGTLHPWFRAGFDYSTGDSNPKDNTHETFFPILPTPRIYARFPFFTQTNLNDAFLQANFRPDAKLTVRTDAHRLWLANRSDLWYAGGGAFESTGSFGYNGRPSGGSQDLATLLDLSVDYQWRPTTTLSFYAGQAFGGNIVHTIYSGHSASLVYVELTQRW